MESAPVSALASMIAARRVQLPAPSSQMLSPGFVSTASAVLFTVKVAPASRSRRDPNGSLGGLPPLSRLSHLCRQYS